MDLYNQTQMLVNWILSLPPSSALLCSISQWMSPLNPNVWVNRVYGLLLFSLVLPWVRMLVSSWPLVFYAEMCNYYSSRPKYSDSKNVSLFFHPFRMPTSCWHALTYDALLLFLEWIDLMLQGTHVFCLMKSNFTALLKMACWWKLWCRFGLNNAGEVILL